MLYEVITKLPRAGLQPRTDRRHRTDRQSFPERNPDQDLPAKGMDGRVALQGRGSTDSAHHSGSLVEYSQAQSGEDGSYHVAAP